MRKLLIRLCILAAFVLPLQMLAQPQLVAPLEQAMERAQSSAKAPLVSRSIMIQRPPLRSVKLSPDGQHIAYVLEQKKHRELWWMNLSNGLNQRVFSSTMISDIIWAKDNKTLFLLNRQGVSTVQIDKPSSARFLLNLDRDKQDHFFGVDNTQEAAFLFTRHSKQDNAHVVYRMSADGGTSEVMRKSFRIMDFLQDKNGTIAFYTRHRGSQFELWHRNDKSEQMLFTCADFDACEALSFDKGNNSLLVKMQRDLPQSALYKFALDTGKWQLLHSDPKSFYSVNHIIIEPRTGNPVMAGYSDEHFSYYALDSKHAELLERINTKLQSPNVFIQPSDALDVWLLVDANPARVIPKYYVYSPSKDEFSRPLQKTLEQLAALFPVMPDEYIASQIPVYYSVSDGMKQQGYVTLPKGYDPASVPLIVMPHGGPWNRVKGGYDARAQFMANRGYAVFQPNFRSSTGFGRQYVTSANKDFGKGRVHQDIIDGMQYILGQGIGNKKKLAIYGHSFGGFSVLGALAFEPQLFQVGIAGAAPVDLAKSVRNFKPDALDPRGIPRHQVFKHFAVDINDEADVQRLASQSPDAHWQQVNKPLYLTAGGQDDRVSILNIRDYALRLHRAGKKISLLEDPNEGHSFRQKLAIEAYFYVIEKALSDHVGGRVQADQSQNLQRYMKRKLVLDSNELVVGS